MSRLLLSPLSDDHQAKPAAVAVASPAAGEVPYSDRADRYLHGIDLALPNFRNSRARRRFLAEQIEAWESLYAQFIKTEGESGPPGADASDYLLTITGLGARLAKEPVT